MFQKVQVILGANIVRVASPSDLFVNLKPVIYQPIDKKNEPMIMFISFQWFHKMFQQLIECLVSMAKRRKLKSWLFCLYDCFYESQVLFEKAEVTLGVTIV